MGVAALIGLGVLGASVALASPQPIAPVAPGTARLIPGDAAVTVHRGTPAASADALLRAGDVVSVQHGVATLKTSLGALYATGGSAVAITTGAPRVTRGDVLVQGRDMVVGMRAATATINGIARVRQGLTLEVDVYRGGAVVQTVTDTVGVPRLRRAVVAGNGSSLATITPLVVNAADKWDRKFLGTAIELDSALSARSRGLTMQVAGNTIDVLNEVVAATGYSDLTALSNEPVGEFVVAAELARAAHLGSGAVKAALRLRSEGASWGLIAIEQGLHTLPTPFDGIDRVVVPVGTGSVANVPSGNASVSTPPAKVPSGRTPTVNTTPVTTAPAPDSEPGNPFAAVVDGADSLVGGLLGH